LTKKYPAIENLSKAKYSDLKKIISPLGLIKRARFLKTGAKQIINLFNSEFPKEKKELKRIIGIGDYMAHAILCFSHNQRLPLVDTNVARVYDRIYNLKRSKLPYADKKLWEFSAIVLPQRKFQEFNLALLDLSALICLPCDPLCYKCPCVRYCFYAQRKYSSLRYRINAK
jgi:A/G-specific adenine glycosylase